METLMIKVKSGKKAELLREFLRSIAYVEEVQSPGESAQPVIEERMTKGEFSAGEKPSDFAGIWRGRKKIDAKKLRQKAWQRKK